MPLRSPRPGESERSYIHYCVPLEIDAGRPQKQALAICYSIYRRKTGKKDLHNTQEGNMTEITVLLDDEGSNPSWEQTLVTDGKGLEGWEIDFLSDLSLATDDKAVTKSEGDGNHPASHYLVVEDPQHPSSWHLRVRDTSGKLDHRLMGAAWAALHDGYRGNKYQGPQKAEALGKLKGLYKQENMPTPGGEKATRPGSLAQTTGSEEEGAQQGMARAVGQAIINAVSGLIKGGKKDLEDSVEDDEISPPFLDLGTEIDLHDVDEDLKDDFDESSITWLDESEASQYEAPDGYKILGTLGSGDELEFVLESLEETKDLEDIGEDEKAKWVTLSDGRHVMASGKRKGGGVSSVTTKEKLYKKWPPGKQKEWRGSAQACLDVLNVRINGETKEDKRVMYTTTSFTDRALRGARSRTALRDQPDMTRMIQSTLDHRAAARSPAGKRARYAVEEWWGEKTLSDEDEQAFGGLLSEAKDADGSPEFEGTWDTLPSGRDVYVQVTDSKAGRRVRSSRVEDLRRLKKEISEALQALDAVIGWADYADKDDDQKNEDGPVQWMSEKSLQALSDHGSVAFSFKAKDGTPWWMQWTMNSFRDREGEIFSTKSISDYVDRHESDDKQGQFWFWHVPGSKFADVRWQAQVDRFLVQAGPFGDDPVAQRFKQFFDDYPDGHPDIAPFGWGTSHRYEYKSQDRQDGVYDWFELKESTVLPWHEASNPWSPRPHTMEVTTVNEKQKAALREIGGDDFVALIERTGQARTKELEQSAIDYKANGSYATRIRSIAAKCDKTEVKAALEALCKELDKQFPPKPPAPPEEEEEEEGKEGKGKKEDETEGSKANTLKDLGEKLHLIAGKAGDEAKAALEAIAKEMAGSEKAEKGDDGEKDGDEAKKDASPDPRYVTKDDFKDAIGGMLDVIRTEISEGLKAIQDQVTSAQEQVKDLSRSDEARIAEKAEGTPTASLEDIMSELLGTDTQIKANSKLARKKPEQADQVPDITGVPGLDWLISQPNE